MAAAHESRRQPVISLLYILPALSSQRRAYQELEREASEFATVRPCKDDPCTLAIGASAAETPVQIVLMQRLPSRRRCTRGAGSVTSTPSQPRPVPRPLPPKRKDCPCPNTRGTGSLEWHRSHPPCVSLSRRGEARRNPRSTSTATIQS